MRLILEKIIGIFDFFIVKYIEKIEVLEYRHNLELHIMLKSPRTNMIFTWQS